MAITSGDATNSDPQNTAWTTSWAKAHAQVRKMKSQADFLGDLQERLYLPQIQQSPTVQLYSKAYRLAAARRHPKRKRLQRNATKGSPLQLPEIRQTWSLFEGTNSPEKEDDDEASRPRRNSDPHVHLPAIETKQDGKTKRSERPGDKLAVSLAVDYTNKKALVQNVVQSKKAFYDSPAYPTRKNWKKQTKYRRHGALEPLEKAGKNSKDTKNVQCDADSYQDDDTGKRSPLHLQNNRTIADEFREEERMKYRLQHSTQNIDEYRKEHDRKIAAGRRIKAPPNSAKSTRERRRSRQFSDKQRKKSKQDKSANGKGNDDSGFSSKTTTDPKRKNSQQEEENKNDDEQADPEEARQEPNAADDVLAPMSEAKREWIQLWLDDCERYRCQWHSVPDELELGLQFQETTPATVDGDVIQEVKMPFGDSPENQKIRNTTQKY